MYTWRWHRYSRERLKRFPFCAEDLQRGRVVQARVTDHIKPHRSDPRLFWDEANHQSLCKPCHDRKTQRETHARPSNTAPG